MSTSVSFKTPPASFSTIDLEINTNQNNDDDDNRSTLSHHTSFHSLMTTMPKRHRNSDIHLQTITSDNRSNQSVEENRLDEDDQHLAERYEAKRIKQEKLLLITNFFRLLIIFILAPIIYFLV